jgi:type IV pilus assembly protein PilM
MAEKKNILTLNLGSQRLGMARFTAGGKGSLLLTQYALTEMMGDPATDTARLPQMGTLVKDLVTRHKGAKSGVYYAISGQSVFNRFVKLPPLGADKVDELIGFEAQQSIPFPLPEVVWNHQVTNKGDGGLGEVEALLVAVRREALADVNNVVEGCSLETECVDVAPLAIYNAFRFNYPDITEPVLVVDLGARTTNLLYIDGAKFFFRSIISGGSQVTNALAKEFGTEFAESESRKVREGFVSLGAAYEDHPDPDIAAMSKVIRNALTRIHGDIVRSNTNFRQQGGTAPERVYLAGGGASLPYVKEFFEEKLSLPVEFFDALRNVSIGGKVDAEQVRRDSHLLGELVGLALRGSVSCPAEIDLVPPTVAVRRDNTRRKPFLFAAAAALLGTLGAGALHFQKAAAFTEGQTADMEAVQTELSGAQKKIDDENRRSAKEQVRAGYLTGVVQDRSYWLEIMKELNSSVKSDALWITELQPTADGLPTTDSLTPGENKESSWGPESKMPRASTVGQVGVKPGKTPAKAAGPAEKKTGIDGIHITGLFRDWQNDQGAKVVQELFEALKTKSQFFDIDTAADPSLYWTNTTPDSGSWAYGWEMRLPLKRSIEVKVVKPSNN